MYDQGGYLPGGRATIRNDTGKSELVLTPIQLSRGSVVMSRASLDALGPDMRERLFGDADVISAEDALAELDEDDDEG